MRTYMAFYNGKQHELQATSSYQAQCLAAAWFKVSPKKAYLITVILADVPVNTASI